MLYRDRNIDIKDWNGERLGSLISLDTETDFVPFHLTPTLATVQVYDGSDTVYYVPLNKLKLFLNMHYESKFIMHNSPFDLDVLDKELGSRVSFDLLDRAKVLDTMILYRLLHLAVVGFVPFKSSLKVLAEKYLGLDLSKEGDVRTTFMQFKGKPVKDIPTEHLEYGAIDAIVTYEIYLVLATLIQPLDEYNTLLSHDIQVKGALALNHIHKNGIGFDLKMRDKWLKEMDEEISQQADILASWGWVRGLKGLQVRYEQALEYMGIKDKLPVTANGDVSSKGDDLVPYKDKPFVAAYLKFHELEKATSFVRDITSDRIHPKYNLIVNTGRTSCSKPNFQQLPRLGGVREMFRAKEGNTLIITDYSAIELATLSQVTYDRYGESTMRDKINDGADLHRYYASIYHSKPESEINKSERQMAKAPNFGFPGGLGVDTFIEFSSGYGLELTRAEAQTMKDVWFQAFPEMNYYMQNEVGHVFTRTGRRRGNTTYCAEKNTPFQGLAADGAKLALYNLDKQGLRVVGFVHDEIITEVNTEDAESLVTLQERIMVDAMREVVPDVKIGVESMISEVYTK